MKMMRFRRAGILLLGALVLFSPVCGAAPEEKIAPDVRCSVCGMFVAKYENWIVQVRLADGGVLFFDGVKDMMVYYFNPGKYGGPEQDAVREVWAKDYYSLQWLDGFKAFYVVGSDVYGPMGKEFIPFATRDAAENFLKDHEGKMILAFDEITEELVQSMRTTKMRHGGQ
jgi:nitrous oxide reductase accessory protein NosL